MSEMKRRTTRKEGLSIVTPWKGILFDFLIENKCITLLETLIFLEEVMGFKR